MLESAPERKYKKNDNVIIRVRMFPFKEWREGYIVAYRLDILCSGWKYMVKCGRDFYLKKENDILKEG